MEKALNDMKNNKVSISTILLLGIVLHSFVFHFYSQVLSAKSYIVVLCVLTALYVLSLRKTIIEKSRYSLAWVLSIAVSVISLLSTSQNVASVIDVIGLFCCMVIVLLYNEYDADYEKAIRLIYYIAIVFAIAILIQKFIPALYNFIITLLPANYASAVRNGYDELADEGLRGLCTNSGSTACYISAGIISVFSLMEQKNKKRISFFIAVVMLVAIFFTGKRGPALFLIATLIIGYIVQDHGVGKIVKIIRIMFILMIIIIAFNIIGPLLSNVPLIKAISNTINGLILGDDVSSMRLDLYSWAIQLFKKNILFGIGWGEFRTTVVGNVTRLKALDVHNIYLQLLCETGIIGFSAFMFIFVAFWSYAKKAYLMISRSDDLTENFWKPVVKFSFYYQTFFLLFGLTGNVLYDQHFQILYAFSCSIVLAFWRYFGNSVI